MFVALEWASAQEILIDEDFSILLVFPVGGAKSGVYSYLLTVQPFIKLEISK